MSINILTTAAIRLLYSLIKTPSFSGEEDQTAGLIVDWLEGFGITLSRKHNNIIALNKHYDPQKPNLLLNSHHDTVQPNKGYTRDPFLAELIDDKLYGLGSNDAGASLVGLLATFVHFYEAKDLSHNLVLVASGEEESSGSKGLRGILRELPKIDIAIIGEPTQMQLAIAEKGLVVFDAEVYGTPGHAAHIWKDNAIHKTAEVLQWFGQYSFGRYSKTLGATKLTVTQIQAGYQHNVVPAKVDLVIDVRVNDQYTNAEIATLMQEAPCDTINPRSLRLNSSSIPEDHALVQIGKALGREVYGSSTLSDQACLSCPSLKLGIGDSKRSHMADEYVYLSEINEGIALYIQLLERFLE